jgi:hypothetical protein
MKSGIFIKNRPETKTIGAVSEAKPISLHKKLYPICRFLSNGLISPGFLIQ